MLRLFSAQSELARTPSIRLAPTTKTERFFKSGSLIPNVRKTREIKRNESNHIMLIHNKL